MGSTQAFTNGAGSGAQMLSRRHALVSRGVGVNRYVLGARITVREDDRQISQAHAAIAWEGA